MPLSRFLRILTGRTPDTERLPPPQVFFGNTLSGHKEVFIPQKAGIALMYSCGPTSYDRAHVGNLRSYIFSDLIARVLSVAGYRVRRVINITDFGHLVSDGDEGDDKMTKGLLREGLSLTMENMRMLSEKYAAFFIDDLARVGLPIEDISFPRASDYIPEQIALITTLEQKGYAYRTKGGVYFDTSRFPGYGKLGGINVLNQQTGTRAKENKEKRHPADFVLWKPDSKLGWESPWGLGFPGWHIECSAMSRALLGQEIDIHTGGEDLVAVHHNNEIAQSESASGRAFAHYWMHNAFLLMAGEKASKSLGNVVYLSDITQKGFPPLALRYFFLQAHYRTPLSFSWDALAGATQALTRLWKISRTLAEESRRRGTPSEASIRFVATQRDDLATPQALGVIWECLKSDEYSPEEKWGLIETADAHLGLSLVTPPPNIREEEEVPLEVRDLLARREEARAAKEWETADDMRSRIEEYGYRIDDGPDEPVLIKRTF